eukprot:TRINITY_DN22691_c0_g1_i1.p2 TRINITY_DN22691_c0_g1~~TRINITY_DN22691_c0_g1_i1.p2  ORF type:complete len:257 (+),score=81.49 TRINITY_DN22691_c0_g1_i1:92-772(+)
MGAPEGTTDALSEAKKRARELGQRRNDMEQELREHLEALSLTPAGLDGPLIDAEGFPRADCDLVQVRTHRNRVACLRNDLKQVMKEAEAAVAQAHALARERGLHDAPSSAAGGAKRPAADTPPDVDAELCERYRHKAPWLKVQSVAPQCPAELSGLRAGDLVLAWNGITAEHAEGMRLVAEATQAAKGGELKAVVRRASGLTAVVHVHPRQWAGRGLLGCHLVPCP